MPHCESWDKNTAKLSSVKIDLLPISISRPLQWNIEKSWNEQMKKGRNKWKAWGEISPQEAATASRVVFNYFSC